YGYYYYKHPKIMPYQKLMFRKIIRLEIFLIGLFVVSERKKMTSKLLTEGIKSRVRRPSLFSKLTTINDVIE
ncbi:4999_t:CDS:2, partial [Racocetra persica]